MQVISEWSIMESFFSSTVMAMLRSDSGPAASIFTSLSSETAKLDAIRAIAGETLTEEERLLIEFLLKLRKTAARDRNRIAHWVWGYSTCISDALLLGDPVAFALYNAEMNRYVASIGKGEWRAPPQFPLDKILVYKASDFESAKQAILKAARFAMQINILIGLRETDLYDIELNKLRAEPQVQEFLSRPSNQH